MTDIGNNVTDIGSQGDNNAPSCATVAATTETSDVASEFTNGANSTQQKPHKRRRLSLTRPVLYCICQQPYIENDPIYGQMIMCDNMQCQIQWFHFKCVNIENEPTGNWYCNTCIEACSQDLCSRPKRIRKVPSQYR